MRSQRYWSKQRRMPYGECSTIIGVVMERESRADGVLMETRSSWRWPLNTVCEREKRLGGSEGSIQSPSSSGGCNSGVGGSSQGVAAVRGGGLRRQDRRILAKMEEETSEYHDHITSLVVGTGEGDKEGRFGLKPSRWITFGEDTAVSFTTACQKSIWISASSTLSLSMADTAAVTTAVVESLAETKTTEIKRSWGDEAEEEQEVDGKSPTATDISLDSLAIDETKKVHKFLDDPEDSNIKAVTAGDTLYASAKTFDDLNLSPDLLKGLYVEMKFERPSKIQTISLPMILTPPYKHLIAQAHNGSGKTTCFVLGMLSRIDPKASVPQALCICPTRELAIQNMEVLKKMGKYTGITSECAIPMDSTNYLPISKRAPITAQVVIGTPGTINKWVTARKLSMSFLKILVFDEADHMLAESGFKDDSVRIMKAIVRSNPDCQEMIPVLCFALFSRIPLPVLFLLFSATFDDAVRAFVSKIVKELFRGDYNQMFVNKEELSLVSVKQYKVRCPDELAKILVIKDRIFELAQKVGQTIIFVRTRNSASMLHKALTDDGYEVTTIQGALKQEDRDKIVKEFKDGLTQVLISTDLLARGFDQSQVNLVVNFDLPVKHDFPSEPDCEVYLHRVGRAGRFGRKVLHHCVQLNIPGRSISINLILPHKMKPRSTREVASNEKVIM
ncbi:P-loop containing nucleoside triphosphate hydrolases superfamily protein [Actinidia rufa]|uniref:RNA helicase n=1 Tax=Actinidia rufa TaxID=165716 RepID=A0A7J0E1C8_9ERIC|nr:P-loop containing nucleoside triphosphate hydrolases superfamily protein [Actinidia rufa]